MEECKNIEEFCKKFKEARDRWMCGDVTEDEKYFVDYWDTYLAMAIIKDIGNRKIAKNIADIMLVITA